MADSGYLIPKFNFKVTFITTEDREVQISFQEVTGLEQEAEFVEYRNGFDPTFTTMKRRGMNKTGQITLKRGTIEMDSMLMESFNFGEKDKYYPKFEGENLNPTMGLLIELCDRDGYSIVSWDVVDAVPVKFSGSDLKSDANEIAIESIEFVHRGITVIF